MNKWVPDDKLVDGPKYLSLVEKLSKDIEAGTLMPGEKLPPQRDIADMFGVTIATVTKAISEASRRGLVVAKKGSGTFVAQQTVPQISDNRLIDLSLNTLPVGIISDLLEDGVRSLVDKGDTAELFGYAGYSDDGTRENVCSYWMKKCGWETSPNSVYATQGTQQGLMTAMRMLSNHGDTVLCEALTFTGILRIADYLGLTPYGVEFDDLGMNPTALEAAIQQTGAKVLLLTPAVQNPTMRTMPAARREEIAKVCERHDVYVVEDGIYLPLLDHSDPPISAYIPQRSVLLSGVSKCVAPGFRLGFAAVPAEFQARFEELLMAASWISPKFYLQLAESMIDSGVLDECIVRHRQEGMARLEIVEKRLGIDLGGVPPSYHAWIQAPAGWEATDLIQEAFSAGLRITASQFFCCPNVEVPSAFRISLGAEEDRDVIDEALVRLAGLMKRPGRFQGAVI